MMRAFAKASDGPKTAHVGEVGWLSKAQATSNRA